MDAGFHQPGSGYGKMSPVSSRTNMGGRSQRRGNYKQMRESREDVLEAYTSVESPSDSPWFQSTGAVSGGSSVQGGFMLATNLSSSTQQYSHSPSSSSISLTPHLLTTSDSPSNSQPLGDHDTTTPAGLLWGEVEEDEEEEDGGKLQLRSLWREGWRAEGLVCSVPRLFQHTSPSQSHTGQSSLLSLIDHPRDSNGHNLVLHSIDLQHHINEVEHISVMSGANFRPSDLPPLPEIFGGSTVEKTPHDPLNAPPLPAKLNLDPSSVALLLRKSTATICCHSGFHSTSLRALDTLAGVMGDFIFRLCKQLSIHSDQQQHQQQQDGSSPSFNVQDPLEKSLWNCGVQGRAELHKFWKTEVEAGMQRLQRKAEQLHEKPSPHTPPPRLSRPPSLSLTPWPTELLNEKVDDELTLEEALNTNMDLVVPATTPDPGGAHMFVSDMASQEPEGFVLLTPDLPARKRLRTSSSVTD